MSWRLRCPKVLPFRSSLTCVLWRASTSTTVKSSVRAFLSMWWAPKVNAARLHGRNRRRSGALPRQRNVFEDEEGFRVRIQTVRNDPVVFTLKANQRRGLSAASITSAELTTAQYIKKSGQGTWRLRATPPARSALPSHREPSAKQLARIVGNSLRAKHT
jgi:hypothetical protein